MPGGRSMRGSPFGQRNQASLTAMAFSVVYVLIAVTSHFVLLGIAPAFMTYRAFQRKEPLAPVALIAAIVTVGTALAFFR
jgi:hypothetical protein